MSWWERPLALLRGDRTATPPAEASAPATAPAHGEWNDVPRLQRVLAEPLRPVAINDDFRGSLASFADPSFMTPAAHRIDPAVGGLVEGLASPGRPLMSDGPELAVPPNAPRPSTPGHAVQRLISFGSDAPELAVVPLEVQAPRGRAPRFARRATCARRGGGGARGAGDRAAGVAAGRSAPGRSVGRPARGRHVAGRLANPAGRSDRRHPGRSTGAEHRQRAAAARNGPHAGRLSTRLTAGAEVGGRRAQHAGSIGQPREPAGRVHRNRLTGLARPGC